MIIWMTGAEKGEKDYWDSREMEQKDVTSKGTSSEQHTFKCVK